MDRLRQDFLEEDLRLSNGHSKRRQAKGTRKSLRGIESHLAYTSLDEYACPFAIFLCAFFAARVSFAAQPAAPLAFPRSTQMIVVVTSGRDVVEGRLERFERDDPHEPWRSVGEPIPIVVGSKGMGWGIGLIDGGPPGIRAESEPIKIEGDGKSPAGVFALGTASATQLSPYPGSSCPISSSIH